MQTYYLLLAPLANLASKGFYRDYLCGMVIVFNDIFSRCKDISTYEARRLKDSDGESLFEVVSIDEQDEKLIYDYAVSVVGIIAKQLRFALEGVEYEIDDNDGPYFNLEFVSDTSLHGGDSNMIKDIEGTILGYVMWQWLSDKEPNRASVWKSIYDTMFASLPKGVYRKRPKLTT